MKKNRLRTFWQGFGMLGRAELAFMVMDIAYLENKILSTEAFYTLMMTAFLLNIIVPISISLWKPIYQQHSPECMDGSCNSR